QLIWKSTTKLGVGCAASEDGTNAVIVANYAPTGNVIRHFRTNVPNINDSTITSNGSTTPAADLTEETISSEVTSEVTSEATAEITSEVTSEVTTDVTTEVTTETTEEISTKATTEVTTEVTEEVTTKV